MSKKARILWAAGQEPETPAVIGSEEWIQRKLGELQGRIVSEKVHGLQGLRGRDELPSYLRRRINTAESRKPYPTRYPQNSDSIGFEVVGAYDKKTQTFAKPTPQQLANLRLLADALKSCGITDRDFYRHGVISYKDPKKDGAQLFSAPLDPGSGNRLPTAGPGNHYRLSSPGCFVTAR